MKKKTSTPKNTKDEFGFELDPKKIREILLTKKVSKRLIMCYPRSVTVGEDEIVKPLFVNITYTQSKELAEIVMKDGVKIKARLDQYEGYRIVYISIINGKSQILHNDREIE